MNALALVRPAVRRASSRKATAWKPQNVALYSFPSQLGWMALAAEDELVRSLAFGHDAAPTAIRSLERILTMVPDAIRPVISGPAEIRELVRRLQAFASGEPVDFLDVSIDAAHLTPFGKQVTQRCREIGWGETLSYRELAAECGRPGAARAVGNVMRNNRFPLLVPCHRVLASGGGLGGYSAPQGLVMKERLLTMERQP